MTLNFFQKLGENRDRMPDHVALQHISRDNRESFSYSRIAEEVSKIGGFLRDQGVGPGQSVAIVMENHPRWGISFLAVQSTGARIVPLDILHSPQTLAGLIQHAECQFLISSQTLLAAMDEVQEILLPPKSDCNFTPSKHPLLPNPSSFFHLPPEFFSYTIFLQKKTFFLAPEKRPTDENRYLPSSFNFDH